MSYKESPRLWNAMCQINQNEGADDQSLLREGFSTLLSAVEGMRNADGLYTVPVWDTPGFDPSSNAPFTTSMTEAEVRPHPNTIELRTKKLCHAPFTTSMTEAEVRPRALLTPFVQVYPTIEEEPIRVAAASVHIRGAFDYSTVTRNAGKNRIRLSKFAPKMEDKCTIFEAFPPCPIRRSRPDIFSRATAGREHRLRGQLPRIRHELMRQGTAVRARTHRLLRRGRLGCYRQPSHGGQLARTFPIPLHRDPLFFIVMRSGCAIVAAQAYRRTKVATLWKGNSIHDGFAREDSATLQVSGAAVQNIIFKQTEPLTQGTHGVMAGAARTKDAMGVFHCEGDSSRCDSVAIHYPGSIKNVTSMEPDALNASDRVFACDAGLPIATTSYEDALYQLGQRDPTQLTYNYTLLQAQSCKGCFNQCQSGTLDELRGICYRNHTHGCNAIMCPIDSTAVCQLRTNDQTIEYVFEDCYLLNIPGLADNAAQSNSNEIFLTGAEIFNALADNRTLLQRKADSFAAWNAALSSWKARTQQRPAPLPISPRD